MCMKQVLSHGHCCDLSEPLPEAISPSSSDLHTQAGPVTIYQVQTTDVTWCMTTIGPVLKQCIGAAYSAKLRFIELERTNQEKSSLVSDSVSYFGEV